MSNLDCPLFNNDTSNPKTKQTIGICCEYCKRKIKSASLIACHRIDDDFMNFNYNEKIYHFCDLVCGKLYDINVHNLAIDFVDYRKKFLTNQLNKNALIIYNQVKHILFTQMPIKYCKPVTKRDYERCKIEYIKIL